MLYDSFFKEIMNPEYAPERLNDFVSLLLGQQVVIKRVLPGDSTRLADESSLLVMDILVELADGTMANIEVQKIGYFFPEARSACYSADLLLRQYKRLKSEKGKNFSYKNIQNVFVIVLFESSPKAFRDFKEIYYHYSEQKTDTGLVLKHPQKFIYLSLDNFKKKQDNGDGTIHNRFEAWLTFLCRDEPEWIEKLIDQYPEFVRFYEDIYELCLNMEKVIGMFSKELLEAGRNTVKLMIDEMQSDLDDLSKEYDTISKEYNTMSKQHDALLKVLDEKELENKRQAEEIVRLKKFLENR